MAQVIHSCLAHVISVSDAQMFALTFICFFFLLIPEYSAIIPVRDKNGVEADVLILAPQSV